MGKGKGIYCTCKEAPLRATVSLYFDPRQGGQRVQHMDSSW